MRLSVVEARRHGLLFAAAAAALLGLGITAVGARVLTQDEPGTESSGDAPGKDAQGKDARGKDARGKAAKHRRRAETKPAMTETARAALPEAAKSGDDASPAPAAPVVPTRAIGPAAAPFDFSAQLEHAGASTCRAQLNALASSTMASVETFNTVSSWSPEAGDKHPVSIAIGQQYATNSAVPFGVSEVIATPNQQGGCDGLTVQVLPSPLPCSKLRETIAARDGRQIGDLAGIPLMQEAGANTMLVPTAANTCVLVSTRTAYAK